MAYPIPLRRDTTAYEISKMLEDASKRLKWQYEMKISENKSYQISIYTGKTLGTHLPEGIEITLLPRKKYSEIDYTGSLSGESMRVLTKELNAIRY